MLIPLMLGHAEPLSFKVLKSFVFSYLGEVVVVEFLAFLCNTMDIRLQRGAANAFAGLLIMFEVGTLVDHFFQ